jgi:hypothetical protein
MVNPLDSALPHGSVRICAMLGTDVAGFSGDARTEDARERLRAVMYKAQRTTNPDVPIPCHVEIA